MNKTSKSMLAIFLLMSSSAHGQDWFDTYGNIGEFAMPSIALGISLFKDDIEGAKQLGYSLGATAITSTALKYSLDATRPNGEKHSMPSGHSSISFSSASYLQMRYGWEYGIPAYIAATTIGWSRVKSNEHYWRDVIVGAGIGIGFSYLFTEKYTPNNLALYPTIDTHHGVGIEMSYKF